MKIKTGDILFCHCGYQNKVLKHKAYVCTHCGLVLNKREIQRIVK
jgi:transcription initiation factor TFIIIB Brf1 subunit/transcription initiation factor TFIIB